MIIANAEYEARRFMVLVLPDVEFQKNIAVEKLVAAGMEREAAERFSERELLRCSPRVPWPAR